MTPVTQAAAYLAALAAVNYLFIEFVLKG